MIYSLLCLLLWGMWGLVLKLAYSGYTWLDVYFISAAASFTLALAVYFLSGGKVVLSKSAALAVLAGVLGGGGYIFFMKALETGKASIVIPLTALYPAVTVILALLLLGEKLSTVQALGITLAIIAAVLLSM
ncbi:MAG: EamA family transporter [Desulfurococcales archaeon]|nr:EamA family transporter [Desulfurococcales archaeon]